MNSLSPASCQSLPMETPNTIAPVPVEVFRKRAARLRILAPGHVIGEYLEAMSHLADAQTAAAMALPQKQSQIPVPAPMLNACYHNYGENWQKALAVILSEMQTVPLPRESRDGLMRLKAAAPAALEFAAQTMICGSYDSLDLATSVFLAAALQVYWTDLASGIRSEATAKTSYLCPICGSPPVAGIILGDRKTRYVCCSLCSTLWYIPRLTCTKCGSTNPMAYFAVEGEENKTKAEACDHCQTYLKLFYLEDNPEADAFADDLASITLDILISKKSYSRSGINLFLLQK